MLIRRERLATVSSYRLCIGAHDCRMTFAVRSTLRKEGRFTTGRLAAVYARAGATDSAMALMQHGAALYDESVRMWSNHPWLMPLRTDPRWDNLIRDLRR